MLKTDQMFVPCYETFVTMFSYECYFRTKTYQSFEYALGTKYYQSYSYKRGKSNVMFRTVSSQIGGKQP